MVFKDILNIDAHFQNSINIALDLNDSSKINSYIPTSTGLSYLNQFVSNVLDDNDHSTMLIAPYGKGKSHAVLVLLSLLASNNYSVYEKLLTKIENTDIDLFNKINKIEDKKYLPVIISNTRGTLNQALLFALQKALQSSGIKEILLETDFHQAYNRIKEWENKYPETYHNFENNLKKRKIKVDKFIKGITTYNESALKMFKGIHKEILSGAEFVSQNTLEVTDYYKQISEKLIGEYNYDGIYIIFDEFSKFLESRDENTISNDMKIIQDLAELCNNSKDNQMYLQLILHKPISDYLSIDKRVRNAFKGIEGRVTPYYFTSSTKNSFDLISNVLQKNENYKKVKEENKDLFNDVIESISGLPSFYVEFSNQYLNENIIDDCYPLHPITIYLLVKINEKVAQNERTLFTFLAKDSPKSLINIVKKDVNKKFIMPDVVFDYFEQLLLSEKDNINIQRITTSALSSINNVESEQAKTLIKTLALLLIVNEKDSLPSNLSVLSLATLMKQSECKTLVNDLIEKGLLVQRHNGQIQFKINMDLNIDNYVNDLIIKKFSKIKVENVLNEALEETYVYPRTYNIKNSITRYFKTIYISDVDFIAINDVNHFFEEQYCDGLILNITRQENDLSKEVLDKTLTISNDRLITVYPKKYKDYLNPLKKLLAIQSLIMDESFIEDNVLIKTELELMCDDIKNVIEDLVFDDYSFNSQNNKIFSSYNNSELNESKRLLSKNRILGDILTNAFRKYPGNFNLELINKNDVKGTYKKARENVIDRLLNDSINVDSLGTSPEDTIINCILLETGILNNTANDEINEIISCINDFFKSENLSFAMIYNQLMSKPYGLRRGIIPILIAFGISKTKQNILISYKNQEVDLSAQTIEMINDEPQSYTFSIDEINAIKVKYIEDLANVFNCELTTDMPKNYFVITSVIRKWYLSLPRFTKQMIGSHNLINNKKYKMLRKQMNQQSLNPSEFVLFVLPRIVGADDLEKTVSTIKEMKGNLDDFITNYFIELKHDINQIFGFEIDTNIKQSMNYWIDKNQNVFKSYILEDFIKGYINTVKEFVNDSESDLINKMSYGLTSFFVEDWSNNTYELFINQLRRIKDLEIESKEEIDSFDKIALVVDGKVVTKVITTELDDTTEIVENFIESTMDDFGDTLTNEQKIALLAKIMKKYL